ncbi:hypothetical protein SLE2022_092050 [Rubroshorea leprosula]
MTDEKVTDAGMTVKATNADVATVVNKLKVKDVQTLTLTGVAGVGKTWMAKQVSQSVLSEGSFYGTVWISVDQMHDETSFWESVARQLSLLTSADEWEVYVDDKKDEDDSEGKPKVDKESEKGLREQIEKMLDEKVPMNKHLLLVLDGGSLDRDIHPWLPTVLGWKHCKRLVTRRGSQGITGEEIIEVVPLSGSELLKTMGKMISTATGFEQLRDAIRELNEVFPADIMRILGAVNCIKELEGPKLEDALTKAASGLTEFKESGVSKLEAAINAAPNGLTELLQIEREVLEAKGMIDYYWHIHDFFGKRGGVHYNELIVHWMLEGYVNPVDYSRTAYEKEHHVLMAYEKGHNVLMKLVDYGLLRLQGDSNIVLQGPKVDLNDERLRGYLWKTNLRLPVALENDKGLGRIAPADGLIKTLRVGKEEERVTTLLVDGSHLRRELPKAFFKARPAVRVLGIFDSTIKSVPLQEGEMKKLFVLVLRSCHLLKDFGPVQTLKELTALEISGSTFLKEIPGGLFEDMCELRSLNLSELGIESLPNISKLTKLQRLILRRCSYLRALPSIRELKDLVVLNLSGCSSLEKMADGSLGHLQELQIIDFSGVKFPKMPIVHPLKKLKQLLLEGCDNLISLRLLKQLTSLQILDLTGVSRVKEVQEDWFTAVKELRVLKLNGCTQIGRFPSTSNLKCLKSLDLSNASSLKDFEDKSFDHLENLQDLNLSNTAVENLPPIKGLSGLKVFKLSGCKKLKILPPLTDLQSLEDLDLSSCEALSEITDDIFEHMGGLKKLNLAGCKMLKKLPTLAGLTSLENLDLSGCEALSETQDDSFEHMSQLKKLNLTGCKMLKKLPTLARLKSVENLDLSGCEALSEIQDDSFEHMSELKKLNLTGCKMLKKLPTLAGLKSLENLDLSGCEALSEIQDDSFDHMTKLQELNLSETQIGCLPSLGNTCNLCCLVLRGCKNLKDPPNLNSLRKLKKLDLFGTNVKAESLKAESLKDLTQLEILGINNIKLEEYSSLATLASLRELSLNGCSGIGSEESWGALTGLEVLELSGEIKGLPSLDSLSKLRVLSLRGCSQLKNLPSLKKLINLEVLDLSGTGITELSDEVSEMAHLKRLHLPDLNLIRYFAVEKVKRLPGDLHWDKCSISGTSLVGDGTHFVKRLKDPNSLNNTSELKQMIFYIHPSGKQGKERDYYLQKYSDGYFKIRDFPLPGQAGQCLEILGFDDYPTDVEDVLRQAEYVSLVENRFLNSISDLHPENMSSMKGCRVERCSEMKSIYKEAYIENLEMLQISSLPKLRSFYEGNVQCFKNLKDLNIDNCRMLNTVFSSKQLLENLETLRIKSCDSLKTVFGESKTSQGTNQSVQTASARKLKHLLIWNCHRLEAIYPSPHLPEKLETVDIRFCDKLQSIFVTTELLEVQKYDLSELPELTTVGFKLQNREPSKVIKCPKLQELNIPKPTDAPQEITKAGGS